MKKTLLLALLCAVLFTSSALADPLTDYRLGHFQVGVGFWGGVTDIAVGPYNIDGNTTHGLDYARANRGNFAADASLGLSHGFAVRYGYTNLDNNYNFGTSGSQQINIGAHEIDLMFKIADSLGGLVDETINLFQGKPLGWTAEPQGRNIYSLFVGYGIINGNPTTAGEKPANAGGYVVGLMDSSQLTDELYSFGRLGLTGNASIIGEAGIGYEFLPGLSASIEYKNYNLGVAGSNDNNDTAFIYRSGFQYGLNYQF